MTIYLAQYLCPARHAIVAMAYNADEYSAAAVEAAIRAELSRRNINPWCGLCGSRDLHFEHGRLKEQDWDAAVEQFREAEAAGQRTRAWWNARRN